MRDDYGINEELQRDLTERRSSKQKRSYDVKNIHCSKEDLDELKTKYEGNNIVKYIVEEIERQMKEEKEEN